MHCAYCKSITSNPRLSGVTIELCFGCGAAYLSAKQWPTLKRAVPSESRRLWANALKQRIEKDSGTQAAFAENSVACVEHGAALTMGKLPNFGWESPMPTCCDMLHLPAPLLVRMLETGLGSSDPNAGSLTSSSHRKEGLLNSIASWLHGKTNASKELAEVSFDDLVWETRLRKFVVKD